MSTAPRQTEAQRLADAEETPMAYYALVIKADSGYEATTEGRCTPLQYSKAIGALMGTEENIKKQDALLRRQDELLEQALEALENSHYDVGSETKQRLAVMDAITAIRAHREAK